jgi:NAD(P)-dependent dehydrogenase (short-subunit alcohol dehydrogenase family)
VSSEGGQISYPNFSLYHATKWGIEGFVEAVAQEVAPFNVEFTIDEPGPAKTSFGGGLVSSPPMDVYKNTPAGEMRRAFAAGTFNVKGDPIKMAQAMIDSGDRSPARPNDSRWAAARTARSVRPWSSGSPCSTPRKTSRSRPTSMPDAIS